MPFKKLKVLAQIGLSCLFIVSALSGATVGQSPPQPLEELAPLFDQNSLSDYDMRSMTKCEDLSKVLEALKDAHKSNLEKARLIHGSAWANFIQQNETTGTVTLVEFSADFLHEKTIEIHKYPKEQFLDDLSSISAAENQKFDVLIGNIKSPGMEITATGYFRRGLNEVEISHPRSGISNTRFNYEQTFLPAANSIDHFCSLLLFFEESERYEVGAWRDKLNLYVKVRFRDQGEDRSRTWKFDLRHGGCVEYQDLMVASSCKSITVKYEDVNGASLPSFVRTDAFDRIDWKWAKRTEHTYFGYRLEQANDNAFSIKNLPVDGEVTVKDVRSVRRQFRKFKVSVHQHDC